MKGLYIFLLLFILSGCNNKIIRDNKIFKGTDLSKPIKAKVSKVKETNVLKEKETNVSKKILLLRLKLFNCGINYIPWKDRIHKDRILMRKILKICKGGDLNVSSWVFHSISGNRDFILVDNHIFLNFSLSNKEIKKYIYRIKNKNNHNSVVKKQKPISLFLGCSYIINF